ncbi:hypothetical protein D3C87_967030 [compost metagenome]
MNYQERVELYRRQLWRGTLRQGVGYPCNFKSSKAKLNDKLMKYARRAGQNYMGAFNTEILQEHDFLIGWAGKKLKAKMREKNRIHLGKKAPKISRRVYKNVMLYLTVRDMVLQRKLMPVTDLLANDFMIGELKEITMCRNGKQGTMKLLDADGTWRNIQWQEQPSVTEADVLLAWAPLTVVRTWTGSSNIVPKPLIRGPRLRPRDPDMTPISEGTVDSGGAIPR